MRRIGYVTSEEGDARAPMTYRVADGAGEREVSWLPAGKDRFRAQEVRLDPRRTAHAVGSCSRARRSAAELRPFIDTPAPSA